MNIIKKNVTKYVTIMSQITCLRFDIFVTNIRLSTLIINNMSVTFKYMRCCGYWLIIPDSPTS